MQNECETRKEVLALEPDSASAQAVTMSPEMSALIEQAMAANLQEAGAQTLARRGRPARLSQTHLAWAVVWCLLMGYHAQLEVWRVLRLGFGCLMPLVLSNQAVYKRLSKGGMQAM